MMTPMRTIIELPAAQLEALDWLCRRDEISRAEAIRRAVALLLRDCRMADSDAAFGLWRDRPVDAMTYEDDLRGEWNGRG
jgi:hypothetical protein